MISKLKILFLRATMAKHHQRWLASLACPEATQAERLRHILAHLAPSAYGREAGIEQGMDSDAFRSRLPIVSYEDLRPWIDRAANGEVAVLADQPIEMFSVTSGTAGKPKLIPVTRAFTLEHHMPHRLWMRQLTLDHPDMAAGSLLTMVSPAVEGYSSGGLPIGSASGKSYENQAIPIRRMHAVPARVFHIKNYEARYFCVLAFALTRDIACVTSVNPSTLYLLGQFMASHGEQLVAGLEAQAKQGFGGLANAPGLSEEDRLALEPHLKASVGRAGFLRGILQMEKLLTPRSAWGGRYTLCTWHGGNAPFYLSRLEQYWGKSAARCLGLRASEGMFSIPLADHTPEGVLATGGHFMEFLPEGEKFSPFCRHTLLAHQLEKGKRYRLILTASNGLCRYDLADIIEVTGFMDSTPLVAFLHKAGAVLSITGEKVTEEQAVAAVRAAGAALPLAGFTVTLRLGELPRYLLAVEAGCDEAQLSGLAQAFDGELSRLNVEYAAKRESQRLAMPELLLLPQGCYANWRKRQAEAGRPDGQIKPPHLAQSEAFLKELA